MILMLIACMLMGCKSSDQWPSKLYINGKESGVPNVIFKKNDVILPLIGVLQAMGGEYCGSVQNLFVRVIVLDKVFHYDIDNRLLILETVQPQIVDLPSGVLDESVADDKPQTTVLLSDNNNSRYVNWLNAEIFVDYTTANNILNEAGINVRISIDYENEKIFIDS